MKRAAASSKLHNVQCHGNDEIHASWCFGFPFLVSQLAKSAAGPPYYKSFLECSLSRPALHPRNPPLSNALQLLIENQLPICICILRSLVFGRGLKPYSISLFYSSSCLFLVFDIAIFPSRRLLPAVAASFLWRPRLQHHIAENQARPELLF